MNTDTILAKFERASDILTGAWVDRHRAAVRNPTARERPIVNAFRALVDYAAEHERRYGSPLGHDSVLGPAWLDMARGLRTLLNGETGRLDCGTIDGALVDLAKAAGFEEEL